MGQKTNPIGLRLGIIRSWESKWFSERSYSELLQEDINLRKFLQKKLSTDTSIRPFIEIENVCYSYPGSSLSILNNISLSIEEHTSVAFVGSSGAGKTTLVDIILGLLTGCTGTLGDLVQSQFKREAGVKDSGNLLPGHGGLYDRMDSIIFAAPIIYLTLTIFNYVS